MNKYTFAATSDIGFERDAQEDFVQYKELGDNIIAVIADGTGSIPEYVQPASIVVMDIIDTITNIYNDRPELLLAEPEFFLKRAMLEANRMLGAFKMGNEEKYSGYAASVTCVFITEDQRFHVAHSGDTRLYVIRGGQLIQLTKDHTKAMELVDDGEIDMETYHIHPDRLKVTGGVGGSFNDDFPLQTFSGSLKDTDLLLGTTDGVHYAIKPDAMADIVLTSENAENATVNLIDAAKNVVKYPDNMTAMMLHINHAAE